MVFRSSCDLQSVRSQFRASEFVIGMEDAPNPKTFRDLDEQRGVFDIDNLPGGPLGNVQRQFENILVRFSETNEAGGNKSIYKSVQLELSNPVGIQFARFVADNDNLQPIFGLQVANQCNHFGERLRLREHEASKLGPCESTLLIKNHPV